jgi:hypothetical protein
MNRVEIDRWATRARNSKTGRFGLALAVLTVLYIGAVIAFIVAY